MLQRIKNVLRGFTRLYQVPEQQFYIVQKLKSIESQINDVELSPVEHYVLQSQKLNRNNFRSVFHHSYEDWRIRRINKILEIYGIEYFKNKKILELGAAHGDIGAFFAELGAEVLCLDGRAQNVNFANLKHRQLENFTCRKFNLENDFTEFGEFDLIINLGLLYHLRNVQEHLESCFKMSDDMVCETVVCDSIDPSRIFFCDENSDEDEKALDGTGSRPSPFYIERIAEDNDFEVTRYFTADLNSGDQFIYDWEHKNVDRVADDIKLRRFWRFRKTANKELEVK